MRSDYTRNIFRLNLGLAWIEGLFVLGQYLRTPSESGAAVFLGFSLLRLSILFGILLVLAVIGYGFVLSVRAAWWGQRTGKFIAHIFEQTWMFWLLICALGFLYFLLFSTDHYLGPLAGHRGRLFPILIWLTLVVFQLLLSWLYIRASELPLLERFRSLFLPAGIALLLVFVLVGFIGVTHIGLTPDSVYWQEAGVPILFAQVLLVTVTSVLLNLLFTKLNLPDNKKVDILIFVVLWAVTFLIWNGQPARPSFNSLTPVAPNFQSYPFGDAIRYDVTAQSLLIGKPIPADFWTKPLYSFFLALLHLVSGQNFSFLLSLQIAFLAFAPAFAYLLTRLLGGRLAGITAALLIILRERNSLALSNVLQVSHAKLLLSDIFSMCGMIVLTWLMLLWLENPSVRRGLPVAIGGVMGLLILMRGHPIVIVPFLFLIGFFFLRKEARLLREGLWRLTVGLFITLLPWFWHTYDLTGRFAFQDNSSPFATRDAFVNAVAEPSDTQPASYGQFETQIIRQVIEQPLEVARFVSAHYFHNMVFSYIYLPQSFQIEDMRSYAKRMPFWGHWKGAFPAEAWLLLLLNASILALGAGAAWKRNRELLFVPLLIGAAYNLSVAISRRSGWRFMLPAEWVTLVFYAIGIVQLILIVHSLVKGSIDGETEQDVHVQPLATPAAGRFPYGTVLGFLLVVSALVWGHKLIPQLYPSTGQEEIVRKFSEIVPASSDIKASEIEAFSQQQNAVVLYGRALYPVFYTSKDGQLSHSWPSFSRRPYNRIVFYLIGPESTGVIFPTDSWPSSFPDGSDVFVVGCRTENGVVQALSVAVMGDSPAIYNRNPMPALNCPLPEPQ